MAEQFGDLLRALRRKAGKTLSQVASAAGVSLVYVSEVERGNRSPFSTDKLLLIANELKTDPHPLIEAAHRQRGFIEYPLESANPLAIDVVGGLVAGLQRGGVTDQQLEKIKLILQQEAKNE